MRHQHMRQGQTTTPETTCRTLSDQCVGSLTSPADHITLQMLETGPTVYSPYPRRHERLKRLKYERDKTSNERLLRILPF